MSFTECMRGYFDDLGLQDGLEAAVREGWLTETEATATAEFHRLADGYQAPPGGDEAVLADPEWARVVAAARLAWTALRRRVGREEFELMTAMEARWGAV